MPNSYGNRDHCIFLEFNTVVGTDAIMYPDGRHADWNVEYRVIQKAQEIRKRRPHLQLVGFSKKGDNYSAKMREFPKYVLDAANRDLEG